jgi:hypothetical protein
MTQQDSTGKLKEISFAFRKVANFVIGWKKSNIYVRSVTPSPVPTVRAFRQAAAGHTSFCSELHAIHQYCMPYILADISVT